jgi:NAD(P)-dependent dehydrogenase (short-subunit alcohol dehydrogenase family)
MRNNWSPEMMPSQKGKRILITGGSSGIGLEAAKELALAGAHVIIAADDEIKGRRVVRDFLHDHPQCSIQFERLDLADLRDVERFAHQFQESYLSLNVLINNAGLDAIPQRMVSRDGHELIFATNFLGHFALTGHLLPVLRESSDPRIITVSSLEHQRGQLNFSDIEELNSYDFQRAYSKSKLALLMFALDLACRVDGQGSSIKSIAVHPGLAKTNIFDRGPGLADRYYHPRPLAWRALMRTFGQSAHAGALPILFAATSDQAMSGKYYGPGGPGELWGAPAEAHVDLKALNMSSSRRLWEFAEDVTGVNFYLDELPTHQSSAYH